MDPVAIVSMNTEYLSFSFPLSLSISLSLSSLSCNHGKMKLTCYSLTDINECQQAALNSIVICDDESMLCMDTDGSFMCVCPQGTEFIDGQCREPGELSQNQQANKRQTCPHIRDSGCNISNSPSQLFLAVTTTMAPTTTEATTPEPTTTEPTQATLSPVQRRNAVTITLPGLTSQTVRIDKN